MKYILIIVFIASFFNMGYGQETVEIYNTSLDGMKQLDESILKASAEHKNLLIQVGGNWCPWCIKFNKFCHDVPKIDSLIKSSYIFVHLNYSKENKNFPSMERLAYPQRFGFPVIVVLNEKGERIHTQDSGFLEKDKGYDTLKVVTFLKQWTPDAINPENYRTKH